MLERLKRSLSDSTIINAVGEYDYFIHPLTGYGVPKMDPSLLNEVLDGIEDVADLDCDGPGRARSYGHTIDRSSDSLGQAYLIVLYGNESMVCQVRFR